MTHQADHYAAWFARQRLVDPLANTEPVASEEHRRLVREGIDPPAEHFAEPVPHLKARPRVRPNGEAPEGVEEIGEPPRDDSSRDAPRRGRRQVVLLRASDVQPEPVSFVLDPLVPMRSVTLVVGQPGLAKTTFGLHLLAGVTRGTLHGDLFGQPRAVLVWSGEDSASTVLVPRLRVAGADLELVHLVTVQEGDLEDGLALPDDAERLEAKQQETQAAVTFVDPIMAAISDSVETHKDHSIRRAIAPLFRYADRTGTAVLAVAHTNKQTQGDLVQRVGGSVGLTAAVRSAMLVARDPEHPEDDSARVLVHGKSNLAMPAPTRRFRVVSATIETDPPISTASILWGEDAPHLTAEHVLRGPVSERPTPKLDAAANMLRELLAEGATPRKVIEEEANRRGISWRTVETAKYELDIDDVQLPVPGQKGPGPSWWFFPGNAPQPNGAQ